MHKREAGLLHTHIRTTDPLASNLSNTYHKRHGRPATCTMCSTHALWLVDIESWQLRYRGLNNQRDFASHATIFETQRFQNDIFISGW